MQKESIFYNNKFLVYGFGKSGYASYKFLSKKNNWITGQIFHIDGGRSTLRLKG